MQLIHTYFPALSEQQYEQLAQLQPLYEDWNTKINVISRKDMDNLYERHVLHALAWCKVLPLVAGTRVLDLGTGGGIPGIPLAIVYPHVHFTLIDGTRKKIAVVQAIVEALGLPNVVARAARAEELKNERFDFVVTRGVTTLDQLLMWSRPLLSHKHLNVYPNGLFAWKGGKVQQEINLLPKHEYTETFDIQAYFPTDTFAQKYLIYVQG